MPIYLYRREDGTTFEYKQKFLDDPLTVDPETGQKVMRVVQATSVIFKGSGFYVNDSKGKSSTVTTPKSEGKADGDSASSTASGDSAPKADAAEKPAPKSEPVAASAAASAAD
ncbi:MAG: FmdB family transcriptional regulator [bacterium]|nr:FmdB family transcriptional regulator [bacterium]